MVYRGLKRLVEWLSGWAGVAGLTRRCCPTTQLRLGYCGHLACTAVSLALVCGVCMRLGRLGRLGAGDDKGPGRYRSRRPAVPDAVSVSVKNRVFRPPNVPHSSNVVL